MLTLANLAVVAMAGTALLGSVAAAPAPQVTTAAAITTSQDALVPIITVTETYTTHGSTTTATITIYAFSKEEAENIAPHTSSTVNGAATYMPSNSSTTSHREPVTQISANGPQSSVFDGMPIYINMPHRHGHGQGHKPAVSQSFKAPERPHPETTHNIETEAYVLPTGVPTRPLTGQRPHETKKSHHKTGKHSMNHYHGFPITEGGTSRLRLLSALRALAASRPSPQPLTMMLQASAACMYHSHHSLADCPSDVDHSWCCKGLGFRLGQRGERICTREGELSKVGCGDRADNGETMAEGGQTGWERWT